MSFTVETGSVVTGANSYASVADADTYHADRGNASWADATTQNKQAALIKATDYVDQHYGKRWLGDIVNIDQPLDWPRGGILLVDYNEIPVALKQAVSQLAFEALTTDLNPVLARGGAVKREKVDVVEIEYMDAAPATTSRPAIDGLLRKLIRSPSSICGTSVRV